MRNARKVPVVQEGAGEAPTLQQLMETISALQEANEQSRQEQEKLREELRKTNEDLRRDRRITGQRETNPPERDCLEPFSQAIMDEPVPAHYVAPKITLTGVEDPESHLTAFNAQMIISGGADAVRCKMCMGTFTSTTIEWFSGLPDGHVTSFAQFAKLFREQFYANRVKPLVLYDLFNLRQREGETLKDYLNRFWALTATLRTHEENVMVSAFEQGVVLGPFYDSLIRNSAETFSEIRRRAITHINTEEVVVARNNGSHSRLAKPREESKASRPMRVNETSAGKKGEARHHPYRKGESKERSKEEEVRPKFRISYKKLIAIPAVAEKLRFPQKTDRNLGGRKDI